MEHRSSQELMSQEGKISEDAGSTDARQDQEPQQQDAQTEKAGDEDGMPSIGNHVSEAIELVHERAKPLAGIYAVVLVAALIPVLLPAVTAQAVSAPWMVLALTLIAGVASFCVAVLGNLAGIKTLLSEPAEDGVVQRFSHAAPFFIPFLWVAVLTGVTVMGGSILFFVPGIIVAILFSLAAPVFVAEGRRGWNALMTSREYIRGYAGETFIRYLLAGVAAFALNLLIGILLIIFFPLPENSQSLWIGDFILNTVSVIVSVYFTAFVVRLYQYLAAIKGDVQEAVTQNGKTLYVVLAVLGVLVFALTLVSWISMSL